MAGADETQNAGAAAASPTTQHPLAVKVAAIQCSSVLADVAGNRTKLTALITEAAEAGSKIIVLPEAAVTGDRLSQDLKTNWRLKGKPIDATFKRKDPLPFAETVPGPSTEHFCELAKRLHVYITVPLVEIEREPASKNDRASEPSPRLFNTVCLVL